MFVVENKFTVLINTSKKHYFIKNWNRISKLFKSMQLNIIFEQSRRLIIISNQKNCIVPTILFKGLMFIRLVNRNVPYMQSKKIFNDSHIGTIIKINRKSNFLLNNFIIRLYKENRAKHMGKLTSCTIIPYGETLSIVGQTMDVIYLVKALGNLKLSKPICQPKKFI